MDTREKIRSSAATVVTGHFDPLTAVHVRRLSELKREGVPLVVVVTEPEKPILPARARAELVAGLACVDEVIVGTEVIREEQADVARTRALIEHIRSRQ